MEDYLRWLGNVVIGSHGEHIQPLYGIGLERELPESMVENLAGYRGMGPVRVGNQAREDFQHDVYGNIVLGAAQAFHDHRLLARAGVAEFPHLEAVGEQAIRVYGTPDAGMWELRARARVHTSSALMSWAACDRLAKIARALELPERAAYWHGHAAAHEGRDPRQVMVRGAPGLCRKLWRPRTRRQHPADGGGGLDRRARSALHLDRRRSGKVALRRPLHAPLRGGRRLPASPRRRSTSAPSGASTHWPRSSRKAEARQIFETMLAARNPLGLLSEDTHPVTGEMWGNSPQTYSMVGIINAAVRLSAPWDSCI